MILKCIKDLKVLNIFLLLAPVFLFSSLAFGQADDEDENIEFYYLIHAERVDVDKLEVEVNDVSY